MNEQTSQFNRPRGKGTVQDILRKQAEERAAEMAGNAEDNTQDNAQDETQDQPQAPAVPAQTAQQNSFGNDEVARLMHELKSAQGRLKPMQQRLEAASQTISNQEAALAEKQRRIDELEAELESLSEIRVQKRVQERRERIMERSPSMDIDSAEALAYALEEERLAESKANSQKQQPRGTEANTQQGYGQADAVKIKINQLLNDPRRNVGSLPTLVKDPEFVTWAETKNQNVPALITRFTNATSEADVDALANELDAELEKYFTNADEAVSGVSTPVTRTGVVDHMTRKRTTTMSRQEYERKRKELMRDVRSSNYRVREEAQRKLDELHKAFHQ